MNRDSSHESDESPENPKAPEAITPVTARPMVKAAGTITGLKMIKSGAVTARQITVPTKVMLARPRSVPPTGRRVTIARTSEVFGPSAIVDISGKTCRITLRKVKLKDMEG